MQEVADDQTLIVESIARNSDTLPAGTIGLELARVVAVIVSHDLTRRRAEVDLLTLRCMLDRCWHQ